MIRSGPSPGVRSRQVPYPPGGPSRPAAVKPNPAGPSLIPPAVPGSSRFPRLPQVPGRAAAPGFGPGAPVA